jgi:type IV secretory pathway VirB10-like protein
VIDKNGKIGLSNLGSLENSASEASSHDQKKTRLNVTVLPKTSKWLKQRGNASQLIDELVAQAIAGDLKSSDHPSQKLEELTRENEELKSALSHLEKESEKRQDYQIIRDKVLTGLKLGKQAPGYKSAVKALDRFIAEMQ